jgi:hypothetical protein
MTQMSSLDITPADKKYFKNLMMGILSSRSTQNNRRIALDLWFRYFNISFKKRNDDFYKSWVGLFLTERVADYVMEYVVGDTMSKKHTPKAYVEKINLLAKHFNSLNILSNKYKKFLDA